MTDRIEIPVGLNRQMLNDIFGRDAADFYIDRINRRIDEGRIYKNPMKTVYLWMVEDRKRRGGYWRQYITHNGGKKKNHGRT